MKKKESIGLTKTYVSTRVKKNPRSTSYPEKSHRITDKIPSKDVVIDPKTGRQRTIRYCENDPSIYIDEQFSHSQQTSIIFEDGYLIVPPQRKNLQDYLDTCNFNEACEDRMPGRKILFKELNVKARIDDNLKKAERAALAYDIVTKLDDSHVLAISRSLGIAVNQLQSPADNFAASKMNLFKYAADNPDRLVSIATDEAEMARIERISDLMDAHKIDVIRVDNNAWRFPEGGKIIPIPMGSDKYAVLSDFTFDTPEGRDVYREILRRVGKLTMDDQSYNEKFVINLTDDQKEMVDSWSDDELAEKAKSVGVIKFRPPYHYFVEKDGDTDDRNERMGKGLANVVERIANDPDFKRKIQARTVKSIS